MKITFLIIIYFLIVLGVGESCKTDFASILNEFVKTFRAPLPLPALFNHTSKETKIRLMSETSSRFDFSLHWITEKTYSENFLLVILLDIQKIMDMRHAININQQIYFLVEKSLFIYEKYIINDQIILKKLGKFIGNVYHADDHIEINFVKRRSNFHGLNLIAMTERSLAGKNFV